MEDFWDVGSFSSDKFPTNLRSDCSDALASCTFTFDAAASEAQVDKYAIYAGRYVGR